MRLKLAEFLAEVVPWAESTPSVSAVALVGSHARGTARPESDVDLVVLADMPDALLDGDWIRDFGSPVSVRREDYDAVQSLRVKYESGLEVEFGIAASSWGNLPLDAGTRRVLADGLRVLFDPKEVLERAWGSEKARSRMNVRQSWERIEAWAGKWRPAMLEDLNPGASDEELRALESALGVRIPQGLWDSLQVHNGEDDGWPSKVFANYGAYLGTNRIMEERKGRLDSAGDEEVGESEEELARLLQDSVISIDGAIQPKMMLEAWIPVMECNGDVFWAIDLAPAEGGSIGQLIEVDWEACSWRVVAPSWESFLATYAKGLEGGGSRTRS